MTRILRLAGLTGLALVLVTGCSGGGRQPVRPQSEGLLRIIVTADGGPYDGATGGPPPSRPVSRAVITAAGSGGSWTGTTDANGTVSLSLPPGGYTVTSSRCQFQPVVSVVDAGRSARASFDCVLS